MHVLNVVSEMNQTDCTIHTLVMQVGLHNALEAGIFRTRGDVTFGLGNAIHVGYS